MTNTGTLTVTPKQIHRVLRVLIASALRPRRGLLLLHLPDLPNLQERLNATCVGLPKRVVARAWSRACHRMQLAKTVHSPMLSVIVLCFGKLFILALKLVQAVLHI